MSNVLWIRVQGCPDWMEMKHSDWPSYKTFDEFRLNFIRGWHKNDDSPPLSVDWVVQDERPDETTAFQIERSAHISSAA